MAFRRIRRWMALIAALVLGLSVTGCGNGSILPLTAQALQKKEPISAVGTPVTGTDRLQVENDKLCLSMDPLTAAIEVVSKADGAVWASNPPADYEDPVAAGSYRTDLKSQLLITYTTGLNATERQTNSFSGSVSKKSFAVQLLADGFRADYTFSEGFTVPVVYRLTADGFEATVLYAQITHSGDNLINDITLLPYFGTAGADAEGYMLVPDGSGALINLNNGKTSAPIYKKVIYDDDPTLASAMESSRDEKIRIPVFGMKKGNSAYTAIVTDGDALTSIQASVAGQKTGLNSICAVGTYRVASLVYMFEGGSGSRNVLYNAQDPTAAAGLTVRYTFLTGEDADYNGMAACYRRYLEEQGLKQNNTVPPALQTDLYGEVAIRKSFLGIQYTGHNVLTSFEDTAALTEEFRQAGVKDLAVNLLQYGRDSFGGKAEVSLKGGRYLGGDKGLRRLAQTAAETGMRLSLHADLLALSSSGNGVSRFFNVCKNINLGTAETVTFNYSTNLEDLNATPRSLILPKGYESLAATLKKAAAKRGIAGLYLTDIAQTLVADYAIGGTQRQQTKDILTAVLTDLSGEQALTMADPNAYLYPAASLLVDLPMTSSRHLLFDADVPFLQMALKGRLPYCADPLNESGDAETDFLHQVETMSGVRCRFMYRDAELLLRTDMIHQYALAYTSFKDEAVIYAGAMERIQKLVAGATMLRHSVQDGLTAVTYDNGMTVYVNYTQQDADAQGVTVPKRGYALVREGNPVLHGNGKGEIIG